MQAADGENCARAAFMKFLRVSPSTAASLFNCFIALLL
jgi:hypothetical protein